MGILSLQRRMEGLEASLAELKGMLAAYALSRQKNLPGPAVLSHENGFVIRHDVGYADRPPVKRVKIKT